MPSESGHLSFSRRLRYRIEAAGFFAVIGFFRIFGIDRASEIGGWIGRNLVGRTFLSRRPLRNLRTAYPEKSESDIASILSAMWDNLGRVMAEYAHLDEICWQGSDPRIELSGGEHFLAANTRGKGVILLSAHFANWEIMPIVAREYGIKGAVIVRSANNPFVSKWLDELRTRKGMQEQISKGQSLLRVFAILRKGETILLLADQRASEGIRVPFFGRDAFTTPAPANIALKLGVPIVPVANRRLNGARFHMRIYPPIEPPNTGDFQRDVFLMTSAVNRFIEERVREAPGEWLWIHKRWVKENAPVRNRARVQPAISG
jgi:Kdo2-lipid IVA lauroyltransferase/acyltransferase